MTLDQFFENCKLKYSDELERLSKENQNTEYAKYWAEKKVSNYIYQMLAGKSSKDTRKNIAEMITGQKTPYYKSGIHEIEKLIINHCLYK